MNQDKKRNNVMIITMILVEVGKDKIHDRIDMQRSKIEFHA